MQQIETGKLNATEGGTMRLFLRGGKGRAQTFVFFLVSFSTVFLLCGMALDCGLWYLNLTRLQRACDSSVITGVANFGQATNTAMMYVVAGRMRTVAAANYYGLSGVSTNPVFTPVNYGQNGTNYLFKYIDPTSTNTYFLVTIATGLKGQITLAQANASAPTHSVFMGFTGNNWLNYLQTTALAQGKRRPRMIVLILDRSSSMISNGGATNLPSAVTNFLGLMQNDTNNNQVGIVSFSTFAHMEMPLTSDYWNQGTNKMYAAEPTNATTKNPYSMKFGGYTSADEGMRLAFEMMRTNVGFTDPQTVKYIVFFTDGQFNCPRMFVAAPTWSNAIYLTNTATKFSGSPTTNMPFAPFTSPGDTYAWATATKAATTGYFAFNSISSNSKGVFQSNLQVFLQPGAVDYTFRSNGARETNWSGTVSSTISVPLNPGDSNILVVPGYVMDAAVFPASVRNGAVSSSTYTANAFNYYQEADGTTNNATMNKYNNYPNGTQFMYDNASGAGYTNFLWADSYMDGELFYYTTGGTTQEMRPGYTSGQLTFNPWTNGIPSWITNDYSNSIVTLVTSNNDIRYYAGSFRGFLKPANWIQESGTVPPTNTTHGGWKYAQYLWTNALSSNGASLDNGPISISTSSTNINSFSYNGAPTHYYDFQNGHWTNFTDWTSSTFLVNYCNWKVMTYASYARQSNVTFYTVGFASADADVLRNIANDRNSTNFNIHQTQGTFYQATKPSDIQTYFTQIAQQIVAFLSE